MRWSDSPTNVCGGPGDRRKIPRPDERYFIRPEPPWLAPRTAVLVPRATRECRFLLSKRGCTLAERTVVRPEMKS